MLWESHRLVGFDLVRDCGCLPLALTTIGARVRGKPEELYRQIDRLRARSLQLIEQHHPEYHILLPTGEIRAFDIRVGNTAVRFQLGQRIRLEISSSNFPRYDPNPNTGAEIDTEKNPMKATQKVAHCPEFLRPCCFR